ncbi:hypothetical protein [Aureimonas sp. AU20]|uniref:hypothetical protein n=1 Tax=Aureimonas sp. AU20 TaxID=1349819 RepID=UPI000721C554|nr:hypothetical protein [Aureimonas sp. AU20]ALN71668.1 hypothetical protein M673_03025 [Aureimonas sp. AU20]
MLWNVLPARPDADAVRPPIVVAAPKFPDLATASALALLTELDPSVARCCVEPRSEPTTLVAFPKEGGHGDGGQLPPGAEEPVMLL